VSGKKEKDDKHDRWRLAISYEVRMFEETLKMVASLAAPEGDPLRNAICESLVLHARNLCDFCIQRKKEDDLKLEDLFGDYMPDECSTLRRLADDVATTYQKDACAPDSVRTGTYDAGSSVGTFISTTFISTTVPSELKSPKWAFDKMLAHLTQVRGPRFNYQPFLDLIEPKIRLLVDEIRRLEKAQGRDFPSFSFPVWQSQR
jgi:hypothetical protein